MGRDKRAKRTALRLGSQTTSAFSATAKPASFTTRPATDT
jgi:hypothetical protein